MGHGFVLYAVEVLAFHYIEAGPTISVTLMDVECSKWYCLKEILCLLNDFLLGGVKTTCSYWMKVAFNRCEFIVQV
jgi:hypothetical protein